MPNCGIEIPNLAARALATCSNSRLISGLRVLEVSELRKLNCAIPESRGQLTPRVMRDEMASKLNGARRTIAVDFDGVIAEYDGWQGTGMLGAPRSDVIEALNILRSEGWKVVVHTTRGQEEIAAYLAKYAIPHDEINHNSDYRTSGAKPVADVYWDDRAVRYSGDAQEDIDVIRNFRTWTGRE